MVKRPHTGVMKRCRSIYCLSAVGLALSISGPCAYAQAGAGDPGWPRRYSNEAADLVVYQPQVDAWKEFKFLRGRCAFALRPTRDAEPIYGTFRFDAETLVDADQRVVLLP